MIVDATDATGRRYQRVDPRLDFTPAVRDLHAAHPQTCVDCHAAIAPTAIFYWRNDATDGQGRGLLALLLSLTADTVCEACAVAATSTQQQEATR